MDKEKVVCETPTPGKKATRIDKWKYDAVAKAIIKSIPKSGKGLLFSELPEQVKTKLNKHDLKNLGSIGWYTTVVKLDLEVKGRIKRVEGERPQRLIQGG